MKHNIIFLLIDSFRADKCYGKSKTSKTPNIDSLIKSSAFFSKSISSADGTTLSMNSIFTGLFPFKTGTRVRKLQLHDTNYLDILKKNGYHIYGVMPQLRSFSDLYDYCENEDVKFHYTKPSKSTLAEQNKKYQQTNTVHLYEDDEFSELEGFVGAEMLSDGLGDKIIDMLASRSMKEPWFFYIHIMDLHWPLMVPSEFDNENYGQSPYERVVSALDFWLGKFLKKINISTTLFVLTGDHGSLIPVENKDITAFEPDLELGLKAGKRLMPKTTHSMGAKFFVGLRNTVRDIRLAKANSELTPYEKRSRLPYFTLSLFDESICVPLVFSGCNILPKTISQPVRNVDVFPTILEIINLSSKIPPSHGRSLYPFFQGNKLEELPAYIHTIPYEKISPNDAVGIRTSKLKYFRADSDPKKNVNLYDLTKDILENINIAKERPDLVDKMEQLLTEITTDNLPEYNIEEITDEEKKKIDDELRKLGYI